MVKTWKSQRWCWRLMAATCDVEGRGGSHTYIHISLNYIHLLTLKNARVSTQSLFLIDIHGKPEYTYNHTHHLSISIYNTHTYTGSVNNVGGWLWGRRVGITYWVWTYIHMYHNVRTHLHAYVRNYLCQGSSFLWYSFPCVSIFVCLTKDSHRWIYIFFPPERGLCLPTLAKRLAVVDRTQTLPTGNLVFNAVRMRKMTTTLAAFAPGTQVNTSCRGILFVRKYRSSSREFLLKGERLNILSFRSSVLFPGRRWMGWWWWWWWWWWGIRISLSLAHTVVSCGRRRCQVLQRWHVHSAKWFMNIHQHGHGHEEDFIGVVSLPNFFLVIRNLYFTGFFFLV